MSVGGDRDTPSRATLHEKPSIVDLAKGILIRVLLERIKELSAFLPS